jgi:hypothetical protein
LKQLAILIPYFNDGAALKTLLAQLEAELGRHGHQATLVIVDDGSHQAPDLSPCGNALAPRLRVRLGINHGHQRAIALGLAWLAREDPHQVVVVMDGDGEDRPEDVERLLAAVETNVAGNAEAIIFAERIRRSEGVAFTLGYHAYRWTHRLLTGEAVRFGNFSAIPGPLLARLVSSPQLWNHYAAAVMRSRIPYVGIPTSRGTRLGGRSSMNWPALVSHGLSALAVFSDIIGARLLFGAGLLAVPSAAALLALAYTQQIGWVPALLAVAAISVVAAAATLAFVFVIQAGRQRASFVPARDYADFVFDVEKY